MKDQDASRSPFLQACRKLPTPTIPFWLPNTTRHSLAGPDSKTNNHNPLQTLQDPSRICEITLAPLADCSLDAVMLYADELLPLRGMGLDLIPHDGALAPTQPIQTTRDIDLLGTPPAEEHLQPVLSAIPLIQDSLTSRAMPLVGWATAPFSLAVRAMEGSDHTDYRKTKTLIYHHPPAWHRLMDKLVTVIGDFLIKQAQAGAQALWVSDPASGLVLTRNDYRRHVLPYHEALFEKLAPLNTPLLYHTTVLLSQDKDLLKLGDVSSLDYRMPLAVAQAHLQAGRPVQINLDPALFHAPQREQQAQLDHLTQVMETETGLILGAAGLTRDAPPLHRVQEVIHTLRTRGIPPQRQKPTPEPVATGGSHE